MEFSGFRGKAPVRVWTQSHTSSKPTRKKVLILTLVRTFLFNARRRVLT